MLDGESTRVHDFKTRLLRLQRIVAGRAHGPDANKHLDAALKYYLDSLSAYRQYNFEEAKRLSRPPTSIWTLPTNCSSRTTRQHTASFNTPT